jgi:hypothetical protein
MLEILIFCKSLLSFFIVPLCFLTAWILLYLIISNLFFAARDLSKTVKLMHQIPCTNCQFFVNDSRLKCTVRPAIANTEEAINCYDYQQSK